MAALGGITYTGDAGHAAIKLDKNTQIYGGSTSTESDDNINVTASQDGENAKLKINLANDLKGINSITTNNAYIGGNRTINNEGITTNKVVVGNTTVNNNGITINNGPTITQTNVDMGDSPLGSALSSPQTNYVKSSTFLRFFDFFYSCRFNQCSLPSG